MRVLVVGAGIGGLCLAQGLLRAGIEVEVYERDDGVDNRYQGYRIGLDQTGIEALAECLPPRLFSLVEATSGDQIGARPVVDAQLRQTSELGVVTGGVVADRRVLRRILLTGFDRRLHFGKALTGYVDLPDGTVHACFADGTTATGELLVGADGIGSTIRRQMLPDARIVDTGVRCVLGRTPLTDRLADLVPGAGKVVVGAGLSLLLGKMCFRQRPELAAPWLPPSRDYLRWVLMLPDSMPDPRSEDLPALIADWHPDLRAVVASTDHVNSRLITIRSAEPVPPWRSGRATVLGDAIHVMSPSGGSGGNTALRDANVLRRKLLELPLPAAVEQYEREMLDYGFAAVRHSLDQLSRFLPSAN